MPKATVLAIAIAMSRWEALMAGALMVISYQVVMNGIDIFEIKMTNG